jgi:hypothetical protein
MIVCTLFDCPFHQNLFFLGETESTELKVEANKEKKKYLDAKEIMHPCFST